MSQRRQRAPQQEWEETGEPYPVYDDAPVTPRREPARLADLIPGLLSRVRLANPDWHDTLAAEWPQLISRDAARHTRPGRMDAARLTVYVDSPVWLHELSRQGLPALLRPLQQKFGREKIRELVLRLDPGQPERP